VASINQEAIQELTVVLELFVPAAVSPGVDLVSSLSIQNISPTGLGGFIALNQEQTADIVGRHINAALTVWLQGNNLGNLQDSVVLVTEALLGAEKTTLVENGILSIEQTESDYRTLIGSNREFKLVFNILYEYRHPPEETQETIAEIPINLSMEIESED
jgi:hypothetical protein